MQFAVGARQEESLRIETEACTYHKFWPLCSCIGKGTNSKKREFTSSESDMAAR